MFSFVVRKRMKERQRIIPNLLRKGGCLMNERQRELLNVEDPPIDVRKFLPDLDELEISEEEKIEFLYILADIMCRFVDLGFGEDAATIVQGLLTCETTETTVVENEK